MIGLSRRTFYNHQVLSSQKNKQKKVQQDLELRDKIEKIHFEFPFYGYRRVQKYLLKEMCIRINHKRIRRVMKEFELNCFLKKAHFKTVTTDSQHKNKTYPNLLPSRIVTGVDQVWVSDITYIRMRRDFLYLSAIMDVYSRKVVGWAISRRINTKLCLLALKMATKKRQVKAGLIHHSDRGVQYASKEYTDFLREYGILISMSKKGNPYDNAYIESFFKTLKTEELYLNEYETMWDVVGNLPYFIEEVYNKKRLHSGLDYESPVRFELNLKQIKEAERPILVL